MENPFDKTMKTKQKLGGLATFSTKSNLHHATCTFKCMAAEKAKFC